MANPTEGMHEVSFGRLETTFDTYTAFVAGDAIEHTRLVIQRYKNKIISKGHTGDASPRRRIVGKEGGKFTYEVELKPEAAGTVPEISPLLTALHGTGSENDGASTVVYTLQNGHPSLQIGRFDTDNGMYEQINGAIVTMAEFSVSEDNIIMVRFEGEFASYNCLMGSPQTTTQASPSTSITLSARDAKKIVVAASINGFPVNFGTEVIAGGYRLQTVNYTTGVVTFTPTLDGSVTAGQTITALIPTPTFGTGNPMSSVGSALSVNVGGAGAVNYGFISCNLTLDQRRYLLNKEATTRRPNRAGGSRREIKGTITVYLLDENAELFGAADGEITADLQLRLGEDVAGRRGILDIPRATFDVFELGPIAIDDQEVMSYQVNIYGQMDVTPGDEWAFSLT